MEIWNRQFRVYDTVEFPLIAELPITVLSGALTQTEWLRTMSLWRLTNTQNVDCIIYYKSTSMWVQMLIYTDQLKQHLDECGQEYIQNHLD